MRRGFGFIASIVFLFFIFLFLFSSFISALCSIGSTPLEMKANVKPGGTVEVTWNFFNLDGDRTTHITVTKLNGPDWTITYDPALHVQMYDVSGVIQNKTENIALENSSVALTIPANASNESYIKHPNQPGYIFVKPVKIYINVPENAKLGQTFGFTFQGVGDCFSQVGSVIPSVATQLKVNITASTGVFTEKPVTPGAGAGTATGFSILGLGTGSSILLITTIVFIVAFFFLLFRGMRKSAREKKQSSSGGAGGGGNDSIKVDGNKPDGGQMPSISFSSS